MTKGFARGTAPDRARPADLRSGTFKSGHVKQGGRKRGTPNAISVDYRTAILEAAHRIGRDGNGAGGVVGYCRWIANRHPKIFAVLLGSSLALEAAESDEPAEPRGATEISQALEDYITLSGRNRAKRQKAVGFSHSTVSWTGQPFPVGDLMQLAVKDPKAFCELITAAFLRPPAKRRRAGAQNPQEELR